jgi:hypothetical protein
MSKPRRASLKHLTISWSNVFCGERQADQKADREFVTNSTAHLSGKREIILNFFSLLEKALDDALN